MPLGGGCGVYPLAGSLVGNWLTVSSSGSSSLKPIVHRCLASLKTKFCVRVTDPPQWQFIASLIKHGPRSKWIGSIRFCIPCRACDVKDLLRSLISISFKDGDYYCYCAYVLRISRYSDFLSPVLTNTGIFLRGLKLSGESRS